MVFKKRHLLGAGAVLMVLTLIFCWRLILSKGVFFGIDMVFFYPLRMFILDEIKSGSIPLWNPYAFCGMPTAGDCMTWGIFYPLNIIFLLFPFNIAFNITVILHIFLAGISMYLFMRSLDVGDSPALISAVTFMFSGYVITITSAGMIDLLNAIAWAPLLFMLFRKALNTGSIRYCAAGGIIFGLQALAGHPQVTVFTSYVLFSYLLFYIFSLEKESSLIAKFKKSLRAGILTFAIGLGLFAIQFFPALEYFSRFSLRTGGVSYDFASSYSLPPKHLITYILPDIFNNPIKGYYWGAMNFDELGTYIGLLPLFLAGYAVCISKHKERSYFTALGLTSLFLAFGKYGLLYKAAFDFLPGFSFFRCPARWLIFTTFSLSVLAGFGLESVLKEEVKRIISRMGMVLGFCCIVLIIFLTIELYSGLGLIRRLVIPLTISEWGKAIPLPVRESNIETSILKAILISGMTSFVLVSISFKKQPYSIIKIATVMLVFFDLCFFYGKLIFSVNPDFYLSNGLWSMLKGRDGYHRVITVPPPGSFGAVAKKVLCFDGATEDLMMRDYSNFRTMVPHWTDLMSGKYILSPVPIKEDGYRYLDEKVVDITEPYHYFDRIDRYKMRVKLYEKANVFPIAFAVHKARVVNNHDNVLNEMMKGSFDPKREVLLEELFPVMETVHFGDYNDEINIMEHTSNEVVVDVDFKSKGFLVMGEVFYPGWKVFIDKKPARLYRANYLMRAVYVDKGRHEVVFQYAPASFKIGAGITLFTIGCIVVLSIGKMAGPKFDENE